MHWNLSVNNYRVLYIHNYTCTCTCIVDESELFMHESENWTNFASVAEVTLSKSNCFCSSAICCWSLWPWRELNIPLAKRCNCLIAATTHWHCMIEDIIINNCPTQSIIIFEECKHCKSSKNLNSRFLGGFNI